MPELVVGGLAAPVQAPPVLAVPELVAPVLVALALVVWASVAPEVLVLPVFHTASVSKPLKISL